MSPSAILTHLHVEEAIGLYPRTKPVEYLKARTIRVLRYFSLGIPDRVSYSQENVRMHAHAYALLLIIYFHTRRSYADGTPAKGHRRYYAINKCVTQVPVNRMTKFLNDPTIDTDAVVKILQVPSVAYLDDTTRAVVNILKEKYSDVLLLKPEDPLSAYQKQLSKLNQFGIVNLEHISCEKEKIFKLQVNSAIINILHVSCTICSHPLPSPLTAGNKKIKKRNRSLTCQLRESKKKLKRTLDQTELYRNVNMLVYNAHAIHVRIH